MEVNKQLTQGRGPSSEKEWQSLDKNVQDFDPFPKKSQKGKRKSWALWVRTQKSHQAWKWRCIMDRTGGGVSGDTSTPSHQGSNYSSHLLSTSSGESASPRGGLLYRWLTGPVRLPLKGADIVCNIWDSLECHVSIQGKRKSPHSVLLNQKK